MSSSPPGTHCQAKKTPRLAPLLRWLLLILLVTPSGLPTADCSETRVPADRGFELVPDWDLAVEDSSGRRLPSRVLGGVKVPASASGLAATIRLNAR